MDFRQLLTMGIGGLVLTLFQVNEKAELKTKENVWFPKWNMGQCLIFVA